MNSRHKRLQQLHDERMVRIMQQINAAPVKPAPTVEQLQAQQDAMRADLALLCGALRGVRYTQTVGEMQRLIRVRGEVEARWGINTGVAPHA